MTSKNGNTIPADISSALMRHLWILTVFEKMCPTCQESHIQLVLHVKNLQARKSRIITMLNRIVRYGKRYNMIQA
jgi:uncharacterized protein YdeI (YjbR/CyaY-like superfamily)